MSHSDLLFRLYTTTTNTTLSLSLCVSFFNANTTSLSPLVTVVNKHFLLILPRIRRECLFTTVTKGDRDVVLGIQTRDIENERERERD